MREITKEMIDHYKIMKLGFDFMGYPVTKKSLLSFHHLIVAHRYCKERGLGEGYLWWNGAILNQNTSHEYLHLIESKDLDIFMAITSEMIDENIKGFLDMDNLKRILDILHSFEREHCSDRGKKGNYLIKEEYLYRPALEEPMRLSRRRKWFIDYVEDAKK